MLRGWCHGVSGVCSCTLACTAPAGHTAATALPLVRALCAAAHRVAQQTDTPVDLLSLLPGSPRSPQQRDLSGGVMERRRRLLAAELSDPLRRAVLVSAGGQFAGHWVQAMPVADCWRARSRLFQLALCVRLGVPIPELGRGGEVVCGGCGAGQDMYGRHPSACSKGNRSSLWTDRHDGLQRALMRARWFARVTARAVGTRDYFGSANPPLNKLRADIICMHYYGMGRHLFVDVAVTEPATQQMVGGARSSATEAGVAAEARAQKKYSKYREACARIDSTFRDAVIERHGTRDGCMG